jgi:hypothetical protein
MIEMIRGQRVFVAACLASSRALAVIGVTFSKVANVYQSAGSLARSGVNTGH